MILVLLVLGAVLLTLPGRYRSPPRHLPLDEWVPLAMASMISGALAVGTGLTFIALPTLTHALGWSELLDSCHEVLAPFAEDPTVVGWLALVLAIVLASRALMGCVGSYRHARATRAEPWLGTHTHHDDFELVVLPTTDPVAFGVPGRLPQVVISEGLVGQLEPAALDALIRHEAAHHQLHHSRHLAVLAGLEHVVGPVPIPPIQRSLRVIRDALEAWADSYAARADNNTPALCDALKENNRAAAPALTERIDRLAQPQLVRRPAARALAYTPTSALAVASIVLMVGWVADAHVLISLGSHCA